MRIEYRVGDLLQTDIQHILHGCNAKGVMGSGVAKAIRSKYPKAYRDYIDHYDSFGLELGELILSHQDDGKIIFNAITQRTYGNIGVHVSYAAISNIFTALNGYIPNKHLAMPMVGAGLGGGDWPTIERLIEQASETYRPVVYTL